MKRALILVLGVLSLLIVTVFGFWVTWVVTVSLPPTMDSYAWQSFPLSNNGGSNNFQITSANFNPKNMRGWVAFDIGNLPSDTLVLRAQLGLRIWYKTTTDSSHKVGDSTGRIYGVYRITQPWQEYKVTWANQPNYTEQHHATAAVPEGQTNWSGPPMYMYWDVTDIVRDWESGVDNYGFLVRDTQENSPTLYSTQFFTHDQVPNQSYYPRLIVTCIRAQSLLWLGGIFIMEGLIITILLRIQPKRSPSPS
jgi:hypothetical protein